jgi:hypothetical protein
MSYQKSEILDIYIEEVIKHFETFEHLREGKIGALFTDDYIKIKGNMCSAFCTLPVAQGQNRKLYTWSLETSFCFSPDALIVVFTDDWDDLDVESRSILIFHELKHLKHKETPGGKPCYSDMGNPILEMVGHDLGEFYEVVAKFGAWSADISLFESLLKTKKNVNIMKPVVKAIEKRIKDSGKKKEHEAKIVMDRFHLY